MANMLDSKADNIFELYQDTYKEKEPETLSFSEYLERCKDDKMAYANWAERLLDAIGEPEIIDTHKKSASMGRVFSGKKVAKYPTFSDFYGMEDTIQEIVNHIKGAAAGTEFRKQVLYLLGPVGGGKSSLGDHIKTLMEENPIYVLKAKKSGNYPQISPIHESPLGLFDTEARRKMVEEKFGIPQSYMRTGMSPWATKRLKEAGGNIDEAFEVVKIWPDAKNKVAVAKVEPGDDNNQDITTLTGKLNINMLGEEDIEQSDTDAYSYSGGLSVANQGVMEFVEMFKAPLKVLNPLLEATQSGHYNTTEGNASVPFSGLILAHSNQTEWDAFASDRKNEAILDRINIIKVPYTLRMSQEAKIYKKMIKESALSELPIAPQTIELLSQFSAMSRIKHDSEGVLDKYQPDVVAKVKDGKIVEGAKSSVPQIKELQAAAPQDEGMDGISTRFAFKVLSRTFNCRANEGYYEADPVLMMETLQKSIEQDGTISPGNKEKYEGFISNYLMPSYAEEITREITMAYTGANDNMCQNMFDRYINMASAWLDDESFDDRETSGSLLDKEALDKKLSEYEIPAGIANTKDFRDQVTRYVLKQQNKGNDVRWDSYEKMATVIRENLARKMGDALPHIKFEAVRNDEESIKAHQSFVDNMKEKGYTMTMIKRAVNVYERSLG